MRRGGYKHQLWSLGSNPGSAFSQLGDSGQVSTWCFSFPVGKFGTNFNKVHTEHLAQDRPCPRVGGPLQGRRQSPFLPGAAIPEVTAPTPWGRRADSVQKSAPRALKWRRGQRTPSAPAATFTATVGLPPLLAEPRPRTADPTRVALLFPNFFPVLLGVTFKLTLTCQARCQLRSLISSRTFFHILLSLKPGSTAPPMVCCRLIGNILSLSHGTPHRIQHSTLVQVRGKLVLLCPLGLGQPRPRAGNEAHSGSKVRR